jgi:small subunit ribosomal protein S1
MNRYHEGQQVEGVVTNVVDFGAFIALDDGLEGLLHLSEMGDGSLKEPYSYVKKGDRLQLRISRLEPDKRRVGFTQRWGVEQPILEGEEGYVPPESDEGEMLAEGEDEFSMEGEMPVESELPAVEAESELEAEGEIEAQAELEDMGDLVAEDEPPAELAETEIPQGIDSAAEAVDSDDETDDPGASEAAAD